MPAKAQPIKVTVEYVRTLEPLDTGLVVDEFVELLKTDDVTRWAEEVRAALADSAGTCEPPASSCSNAGTQARRQQIQCEIERLQRELRELAVEKGGDR